MVISESEIEKYMSEHSKYFEKSEVSRFKNIISESNITLNELYLFKFKAPRIAIILSVFLGWLGIDRFYSGNYIMGVLKLCTFGLSGFWWIIDWFLIAKAVKVKNQTDFYAFLSGQKAIPSAYSDTIKNIIKSKEVRNATKEFIKSAKKVTDSMDIDNNY